MEIDRRTNAHRDRQTDRQTLSALPLSLDEFNLMVTLGWMWLQRKADTKGSVL
jgi:hypothetical protein